jgi:superfamily II DNA helicase RecQ
MLLRGKGTTDEEVCNMIILFTTKQNSVCFFIEQQLLNNEIKVLVATVALGMGFDKPDLGFVIHFQRPASVVHYYQQVGRAGRASQAILAAGLGMFIF